MDVDISISEIINQINGVTSIWLQATSYADRLITELPSIEFCRCLVARRRRDVLSRGEMISSSENDESEITTTTNDAGFDEPISCRCGKNDELKEHFENQNAFGSFVVKFAGECSICLEKYTQGSVLTLFPCGHLFHRKCIYEWFTNSVNYKCPVCRTSLYKFKKSI